MRFLIYLAWNNEACLATASERAKSSVRFKYYGDAPHNMKRCDPRCMIVLSLVIYNGEHAGAYGTMDGMKSLCTGSGLKSGV